MELHESPQSELNSKGCLRFLTKIY
uniref:Uncharacterized protein n=1 Tax=Arundo donax TaxID=35708 RepID=A0A0A9BRW9_ARUDO